VETSALATPSDAEEELIANGNKKFNLFYCFTFLFIFEYQWTLRVMAKQI